MFHFHSFNGLGMCFMPLFAHLLVQHCRRPPRRGCSLHAAKQELRPGGMFAGVDGVG